VYIIKNNRNKKSFSQGEAKSSEEGIPLSAAADMNPS
jgi:hypothetical protein